MLTEQHRKEGLSRAYLQAVASHAGLCCNYATLDYGVDATVHSVVELPSGKLVPSGFPLDLQLKATVDWQDRDGSIAYDLQADTYNSLVARANQPRATPLVLILLCLPQQEDQWLSASVDQMILRHCCYWLCLKGEHTTNTRTKTILIPKVHVLDTTALARLIKLVETGQLA
jgi:hypothetical protein